MGKRFAVQEDWGATPFEKAPQNFCLEIKR
jgi:hypothetical protein